MPYRILTLDGGGLRGLITAVLLSRLEAATTSSKENFLKDHPHPASLEFYLCGPPMMIKACSKMLLEHGITPEQIAYDEF